MRAPKPVGRPALDIAGGVVLQPLNRLTGLQGRMLYADMSRDPVLSGLLLAVRHAAAQVEWSWEPPEQGGSGELGLIEEAWAGLRPAWPDVLNAVLQEMLTYGFTLYEPVYQIMNNRVVWDTFSVLGILRVFANGALILRVRRMWSLRCSEPLILILRRWLSLFSNYCILGRDWRMPPRRAAQLCWEPWSRGIAKRTFQRLNRLGLKGI